MRNPPMSEQKPCSVAREVSAPLRSPWPLRTLALGTGFFALQAPGTAGVLAATPWVRQLVYSEMPGFLRDAAAFLLLGFVIERQLGPRFWAACAWAFLGTGLVVEALFPGWGGIGLSGVLNALLFIALWETWRRRGGLLLPALMFAGSLGVALIALPGIFAPQDPWCFATQYIGCFAPAAGYACGALWAVFHACRDTLRELGLMTRLSWKMY